MRDAHCIIGCFENWNMIPTPPSSHRRTRRMCRHRGKYPRTVKARSVLCYRGEREMGLTTVDLGKRLDLAQPTISQAVARGQKIASEMKLRLIA